MINKLKGVSDDGKRLLSNFFSLSALQGANYLLPLITLPYLVRVLGPEKFGLIAFAQAFIQYFIILTDYGFYLSATREISIHREDREKVSEIFSSVMLIKFALMILSFIFLSIVVFTFTKFRNDWQVYFLAFGTVIGQVLFPFWFFQGIERMKHIAILNILAKLLFTISIFIIIKNKNDYIYVPLLNSMGSIIAGIISLWVALRWFKVRVKIPSPIAIKQELKNGWHIFISKMAIGFYTTSNTVILGFFTNNTVVGYYAAGEKVIRAIQGLQIPFSQAVYPYISKLASESTEKALGFVRKAAKLVSLPTVLVSLLLLIFARHITRLVLGEQFQASVYVIKIQSFLPFIVGLASVYANFFLLGFGYTKIWSRIIMFAGCVSLIGAVIFVYLLQMAHIGISINVLLTELIVLSLSFVAYRKLKSKL